MRQTRPKMKVIKAKRADAVMIRLKNLHSTNVQRNVCEMNIADQPTRYASESDRKISIGTFHSRRTESQPYVESCVRQLFHNS